MYSKDKDYIDALESSERSIETKIIINDSYEFTDEIVSCTITRNSMKESHIGIGEVISDAAKVKMIFKDSTRYLYITESSSMRVYHRVNNLDWIPIGIFYIDSIEKTPGTYNEETGNYNVLTFEIEAYDIISTLTSKVTTASGELRAVVSRELNLLGISIDNVPADSYRVEGTDLTQYTVLQLLQYTAGLYGMNVRSTRDGNLTYYWYTDADYTVGLDVQMLEKMSTSLEYNIVVDGLIMGVDNTSTYNDDGTEVVTTRNWSKGDCTAGNTITHTNPFATESIVESVYNKVKDFTYRALTCDYRGNTLLEKEDIVKVEDTNGDVYTAILSEHELVLTGMTGTITCEADSESSSESLGTSDSLTTNTSGSMSSKFNKITAKVAEIGDAYISKANIGSIVANKIQTDEAVIKSLKSNYADIKLANIEQADIDNFDAKTGFVKDLTTDTITSGVTETVMANIENGVTTNSLAKLLLAQALMSKDASITNLKSSDITVEDDSGNTMQLLGASEIFRDSDENVRVVLGKHNDTDYNLTIYDAEGNELFNADGVTYEGALKSDIATVINNDGYTSLINASRLNISSLVDALNGDNYLTDTEGNRLYVYKDLEGNVIELDTSLTKEEQKAIYVWDDSLDAPMKYYLYSTQHEHLKASSILYEPTEQTLDVLFTDYVVGEDSAMQSSYQLHNGLLDFLISNVDTSDPLTEKPSDWNYAYYKYYYLDSTTSTYRHLTELLPFESGKYYKQSDTYSNIKMTKDSLSLIADNIDLTGKVTFASLDSEVATKINSSAHIYYGTTSETYENVSEGDYLVDSSTGNTYKWSKNVNTKDVYVTLTGSAVSRNGGSATTYGSIDYDSTSIKSISVNSAYGRKYSGSGNIVLDYDDPVYTSSGENITAITCVVYNNSTDYATKNSNVEVDIIVYTNGWALVTDLGDLKNGLSAGTTTINGNCITTGKIIANNGVYSLDMSTGKVIMKDGEFSGSLSSPTGNIGGLTLGDFTYKILNDNTTEETVVNDSGMVKKVTDSNTTEHTFAFSTNEDGAIRWTKEYWDGGGKGSEPIFDITELSKNGFYIKDRDYDSSLGYKAINDLNINKYNITYDTVEYRGNSSSRFSGSGMYTKGYYEYAEGTVEQGETYYNYDSIYSKYSFSLTSPQPIYVNGTPFGSDSRLKRDIANIDDVQLDVLHKFTPRKYRFNDNDVWRNGFIAQEVEDVYKELGINEEYNVVFPETLKSGYYAIDYNGMVALLWKIVQEKDNELQELKSKVDDLEARLLKLENGSNE